MEELSEYEEACIRAKKRIELRYAVDAGMEPKEKRPWESEAKFRERVRETLLEAPWTFRAKMQEDKRTEYMMLRREYKENS